MPSAVKSGQALCPHGNMPERNKTNPWPITIVHSSGKKFIDNMDFNPLVTHISYSLFNLFPWINSWSAQLLGKTFSSRPWAITWAKLQWQFHPCAVAMLCWVHATTSTSKFLKSTAAGEVLSESHSPPQLAAELHKSSARKTWFS